MTVREDWHFKEVIMVNRKALELELELAVNYCGGAGLEPRCPGGATSALNH